MDARDLPTNASPAARRLTRLARLVLAALIAWALWVGYGALLSGGRVH